MSIVNRLRRSIEKNAPEVRAMFTGQMPGFVFGRQRTNTVGGVPIFMFHDVDHVAFERQLLFLRTNGYETVNCQELEDKIRYGSVENKSVALTFDDATSTFWTYAFPLLIKYDFQAILFVIPGVVQEEPTQYPNLTDFWSGSFTIEELDRKREKQPFCTWRELIYMHASGNVDIQSHSLTHSRVTVSKKLIDFLHPDYDCYAGNFNIPVSRFHDVRHPARDFRLGAPVFESAPRLACKRRFKISEKLQSEVTEYVSSHGEDKLFRQPTWRSQLTRIVAANSSFLGEYESLEDMHRGIHNELLESKNLLESKLADKIVRHFCYPWHGGSLLADQLAADAGYTMVHYGPYLRSKNSARERSGAICAQRILDDYIFRLPGKGRLSISSLWNNRIFGSSGV